MNRTIIAILAGVMVLSAAFASDAEALTTYNPTTSARTMTPLSNGNILYPQITQYSVTPFTKGMTRLTGGTMLWAASQGTYWYSAVSTQNLGFNFSFFGTTYNQVHVCSNGYISFVSNQTGNVNNVAIPTAGTPDGYIALFWDYLYVLPTVSYPECTAVISCAALGTAPNRRFVVEYYRQEFIYYNSSGPPYYPYYCTGQIILYEGSNTIELQYDNANQNWGTGFQTCTIGIEDPSGAAGYGGPNTGASNSSCPTVNYRFAPVINTYDDSSTQVSIPFNFFYYGTAYTLVDVSTNGFITFVSQGTTNPTNDPIPTATAPNGYVSLFWDDLIVQNTGVLDRISYGVTGTVPNRVFVVEYYGVTRKGQSSSEMTGQILLYEGTNRIELAYDGTSANNNWVGVSATIGVEDLTGANGYGGPNTGNTNATLPTVNYRYDPVTVYYLTVVSAYGSPTPTVGLHSYGQGAVVSASSNSPASGGAGTRYVCTGWVGTGDVPLSGTATSLTFTLQQDSSITWQWVPEYLLTLGVSPAGAGTVSSNPAGPWIQPGTMVQLRATPNTGWLFNNWTGGLNSINNPDTITISGPVQVTANFQAVPFTLTVGGQPSAVGTPVPAYGVTSYALNTVVTCSVVSPVAGAAGVRYVCTGWVGTGNVLPTPGAGTSVTFTVTQNSTITWQWQTQYQLTTAVSPVGTGMVSLNPVGPWYASGANVQVTGNAGPGYQFSHWTGAATTTNNPETVAMTGPGTVTGNFVVVQRTLTVSSAHGSPSPGVGVSSYSHGTTVTCTVDSPVAGGAGVRYVCTGWTGTGSVLPLTGTGMSVSFAITSNSTLTWQWQTQYEVTTSTIPVGTGTVGLTPLGGWYAGGTVLTVQATPNTGYNFTGWSGALGGAANPGSLTVSGPGVATANFLAQGPSLTVSSAYGSPVPGVGSQAYATGTMVSCTVASPVSGGAGVRYVCTGWAGTGSVAGTGTGTSFSAALNVDSTVTWVWQVEYEVQTTSTPAGGGAVALTPAGPWMASGTTVSASATSAGGYVFFEWRGDGSGRESVMTGMVDGPKTFEATFLGEHGLGLTAGPCNALRSRESMTAAGVPVLQMGMKAGPAEGVSVGWVRVSVSGSSDESATVSGVAVYWDKDRDGIVDAGSDTALASGLTFGTNDGSVMATLSPALTVPAGSEECLLVAFDWTAGAGSDFRASVSGNGDVGAIGVLSSAGVEVVGAPVRGGRKDVVGSGNAGTLELYRGLKTPAGRAVGAGTTNVAVLQVLARAGSVEGVAVSTVTLRGWGTGNETGVGEVRLYRDGNEDGRWDAGDTLLGSWGTYGADEGTVTFAGLTEYVAAQTQASWVVVYDFGTGAPEGTYGAKVEKGTDVWGVGSVSGGGVTVWGAPVSGEAVSVEKASGSAGDYAAFAGGCVPGAGGAPLWPLLPLAAALWALARRKRRE